MQSQNTKQKQENCWGADLVAIFRFCLRCTEHYRVNTLIWRLDTADLCSKWDNCEGLSEYVAVHL